MPVPADELLTTEQVAARLGVGAARVRQLVRDGRLTPVPLGLRAHVFSLRAVLDFENSEKPRRGRPKND